MTRKPLNLCVTVTIRLDMLGGMLRSAFAGTVKPDRLFIVDQANDTPRILSIVGGAISQAVDVEILHLGDKQGCEASAVNWYLQNVPEERVIAHEDLVLGERSLETFIAAEGAFLIDDQQGLIMYRDEAVRLAGLYDTEMSPNYFRYVDADYEERLAVAGIEPTVVACGVQHLRDGTMKGLSPEGLAEYHRRVGIADANYARKWGRPLTPGGSTIGRSHWRRQHGIGGGL